MTPKEAIISSAYNLGATVLDCPKAQSGSARVRFESTQQAMSHNGIHHIAVRAESFSQIWELLTSIKPESSSP